MNTTVTVNRDTASAVLLVFLASLVCHVILVPVGAWNHNLALVIVAAIVPMIFTKFFRMADIIPPRSGGSASWVKSIIALTIDTAVITILLWNHLWLLAILAFVVSAFTNKKK
jgi:chromate transport protein ChrA